MGILDMFNKLTTYLNQIDHVVRFQKFCGVEFSPDRNQQSSAKPLVEDGEVNEALIQVIAKGESGYECKANDKNICEKKLVNGLRKRNYLSDVGSDSSDSQGVICFGRSTEKTLRNTEEKDAKEPQQSTFLQEEMNHHIQPPYVIRNKPLYYIFSVGASLANEDFHLILFPMCLWNFDSYVARRVCIIWWIVMYVGQATKDIIKWQRPKSPPVVRIEEKASIEYSMPSTHTMTSAGVAFSLLFITLSRYDVSIFVCTLIVVLWCSVVSLSRIYRGMHTPLDIIVALMMVTGLNTILIPLSKHLDWFNTTHPLSVIVNLILLLILCYIYPSGRWTTAIGDAITIVSVGAGFAIGSWLNWNLGYLTQRTVPNVGRFSVTLPSFHVVCVGMLRYVIGMIILLATRSIFKPLSRAGIQKLVDTMSQKAVTVPPISDPSENVHTTCNTIGEARHAVQDTDDWVPDCRRKADNSVQKSDSSASERHCCPTETGYGQHAAASLCTVTTHYSHLPESHDYALEASEVVPSTARYVEMGYKGFTYILVAVNATFTIPLIFCALNINRDGYYNELF